MHSRGPLALRTDEGEQICPANRLLISSLLGFDMRGYRDRLDQSPAGLTILDFMSEVRPRLRLFNDVSHYENVPQRILT